MTMNMTEMFCPDRSDELDDLREEVRLCGDPVEQARLRRRLEDLETREAERLANVGAATEAQRARVREGERRMAASKARYEHRTGALASGVTVSRSDAEAHALSRLLMRSTIELAHERLVTEGQHPVHVAYRLKAFIEETKRAQPALAKFIDQIVVAGEVPGLNADEGMLFEYTPPPPAPPPWPEPVPEYVALVESIVEAAIRDGHILSHKDPLTWRVQECGPLVFGNARSARDVLACVKRGAQLAWLPGTKRVQPPVVEGARWVEAPQGGSMLLELVEVAEQAAQ
jgi:hypothetical protein